MSSNTITDVIAGTTLKLQADTTATVNLTSSRSKDNVMSSVKDMISNINSFIVELNRLTYIDTAGDNDGALALDLISKADEKKVQRYSI